MSLIYRLRRRLPEAWFGAPPPVVPVVRLHGIIGSPTPFRDRLSLSSLASTLAAAFRHPGAVAVALVINSPGGAPVQSALIAQRIRALAEEHSLPVIAFVEDVAASGGYWLACAGDEIYAQSASIVGSIGVISAGFGLDKFIARHGIERRLHTAGTRKSLLDPFLPEDPEQLTRLEALQDDIHKDFQDWVKERRDKRLKGRRGDLFSGEFWTGRRALALGLVDGLGDARSLLRQRYGEQVKMPLLGGTRRWWRRGGQAVTSALGHSLGQGLSTGAIAAVEERLMWQRFGLD